MEHFFTNIYPAIFVWSYRFLIPILLIWGVWKARVNYIWDEELLDGFGLWFFILFSPIILGITAVLLNLLFLFVKVLYC